MCKYQIILIKLCYGTGSLNYISINFDKTTKNMNFIICYKHIAVNKYEYYIVFLLQNIPPCRFVMHNNMHLTIWIKNHVYHGGYSVDYSFVNSFSFKGDSPFCVQAKSAIISKVLKSNIYSSHS